MNDDEPRDTRPRLSLNPQRPADLPVMGLCGVGFGILGIFTIGYVFTPIGIICSVIALFVRQAAWGFVGLLVGVFGVLTSPVLMTLIGMGATAYLIDLPWN